MFTFNAKETGKRIRNCREELCLTIVQTAFSLSVTPDHLRKIERGERNPSLDFLLAASDYFDVSTDFLLKGMPAAKAPKEEISKIIEALITLKAMM